MKKALAVLALLGLASQAAAQTINQKLQWTQTDVTTVAAAQAYAYRLQVDGGAIVPVVQTCTLAGAVVTCTTPIATLGPGQHTLTLIVDNGFGSASTTINGTAPTGPFNLKILITISVP